MQKAVIVIPVHNPKPGLFELISFEQCFKILGNHPIVIITPVGLDLTVYRERIEMFNTIKIKQHWLSSVEAYNKLKKSMYFYNLFKQYEYILTYELDAFVFKDELMMWCAKGFDYIGAPWFEKFTEANSTSRIIGVGNSGFSLRKTKTIKKYLSNYVQKSKRYYSRDPFVKLFGIFEFYLNGWLRIFYLNKTVEKFSNEPEDMFICYRLKMKFPLLNIATVEEAKQFSFEFNPETLYYSNKGNLPFGCHAWWRYDLEFWRPHINKAGYSI